MKRFHDNKAICVLILAVILMLASVCGAAAQEVKYISNVVRPGISASYRTPVNHDNDGSGETENLSAAGELLEGDDCTVLVGASHRTAEVFAEPESPAAWVERA